MVNSILEHINPQTILATIAIFGVVWGAYRFFFNSKTRLEKAIALIKQDEVSKAAIVSQKLKSDKEVADMRFKEMTDALNQSNSLAMNHIHTIDTKLDSLCKLQNEQAVFVTGELIRLSTIIEERIPKTK